MRTGKTTASQAKKNLFKILDCSVFDFYPLALQTLFLFPRPAREPSKRTISLDNPVARNFRRERVLVQGVANCAISPAP